MAKYTAAVLAVFVVPLLLYSACVWFLLDDRLVVAMGKKQTTATEGSADQNAKVIEKCHSGCLNFDDISLSTAIATGYAPLDPNAKEGTCYSGDPTVTASGAKTTPRRTLAADKAIPFGTRVRIEGFTETFVVEDRGSKITGNRIDICFATQKEALDFGRKSVAVFLVCKGDRNDKTK